ncbi:MAG: putative toxin-antitoxin system toxin component, PIN family [Flavobacteriales bacterium]|nr:putative toxin-antitoxin system toxin component, PIN family [Flavobacteriales bacterium]
MKPLRVVVDCNIFISILIGGSMKPLRDFLFSDRVRLVISEDLLAEIVDVGDRSHLRRYFDHERLHAFIILLREFGDLVEDPTNRPKIARDPDDDYLLALSKKAKADVLLTGDKGLLVLNAIGRTRIMKPKDFLKEYMI